MAEHRDPMVGLATQTSDADFNEEHTRAPREVGDEGFHCGHCTDAVPYQNMQVLRDSKVTCLACYNLKYREGEHPDKGVQQETVPTVIGSGVCKGNAAVGPGSDKINREGFYEPEEVTR